MISSFCHFFFLRPRRFFHISTSETLLLSFYIFLFSSFFCIIFFLYPFASWVLEWDGIDFFFKYLEIQLFVSLFLAFFHQLPWSPTHSPFFLRILTKKAGCLLPPGALRCLFPSERRRTQTSVQVAELIPNMITFPPFFCYNH